MEVQKTQSRLDSNRRKFLIGMAVAGVSVSAGLYGISIKQTPNYDHPAYSLWQGNKENLSDIDFLVLCGGVAPSPHNTQPWKFEIEENTIHVFGDKDRSIGRGDSDYRQMHISLGCAMYNMQLAAKNLGYKPVITYQTMGDFNLTGHVASIEIQPSNKISNDEVITSIFKRSTNRGNYDLQLPIPDKFLRDTKSEWSLVDVQLHKRETLPGLHIERSVRVGARKWMLEEGKYSDSTKWWRYTRDELLAKGDGVSIHTSETPFFIKEGMEHFVDEEMWLGDFGKNGELSFVDGIAAATPMWGVIETKDDSLKSRLEAGMMLEKTYINAARSGIHLHPINYAIENVASHDRLINGLGMSNEKRVQMVFRVGKGVELERTVRKQLSEIKV